MTLLKTKELAQKLSLSDQTIRNWAKANIIPSTLIGKRGRRYDYDKVVKALEDNPDFTVVKKTRP